MKTKIFLPFISMLLFSAVAGTQLVRLGRANGLPGINPNISISTPPNATYNEKIITMNCSAAYNWEGCSLWYSLDGERMDVVPHQAVVSREDANAGKNFRVVRKILKCSAVLSNLAEGWHTVTFYLVANMKREVVYSASTKFKIDSVSPEVSILSPLNETYDSSAIPLNFTVSEVATLIRYSLDGGEKVTVAENTTLAGLYKGEHNVTVYATDKAGNTGASETIFFTIAEPPEPFPTTMVIAPIALLSVIGSGLVFYSKKRKVGPGVEI